MPRYELVDGKSKKFWEISLSGSDFTTSFGRLGTKGQTKTKSFASPAAARSAYDKLVAEKEKKGYVLTDEGAAPATAAPVAAAPAAASLG